MLNIRIMFIYPQTDTRQPFGHWLTIFVRVYVSLYAPSSMDKGPSPVVELHSKT